MHVFCFSLSETISQICENTFFLRYVLLLLTNNKVKDPSEKVYFSSTKIEALSAELSAVTYQLHCSRIFTAHHYFEFSDPLNFHFLSHCVLPFYWANCQLPRFLYLSCRIAPSLLCEDFGNMIKVSIHHVMKMSLNLENTSEIYLQGAQEIREVVGVDRLPPDEGSTQVLLKVVKRLGFGALFTISVLRGFTSVLTV